MFDAAMECGHSAAEIRRREGSRTHYRNRAFLKLTRNLRKPNAAAS